MGVSGQVSGFFANIANDHRDIAEEPKAFKNSNILLSLDERSSRKTKKKL